MPAKLLIVTDAWHPQTNGVVRSLAAIGTELGRRGMEVTFLTPERFWTVPVPTYPEIRLSLTPIGAVGHIIDDEMPDHIHIATEGPLGLQARKHCTDMGLHYTTSFHTRFPEYVAARVPVPPEWCYAYLRWFHADAAQTLVPTASMLAELEERDFRHLKLWSRGVDTELFSPGPKTRFHDLPGPHLLYVGRVAPEKNVEAFLRTDVPGTKIVVGDGPQREELEHRYPDVAFLGYQYGEELAATYRSADVFVFPSLTDTFGNVMVEAMASGVPVAAYPVTGPRDVLTGETGVMNEDLGVAIRAALELSREAARRHAQTFTWKASGDQFASALVPAEGPGHHHFAKAS